MKRIAIIQINEEGEKIASQIRQHFPKTIIISRESVGTNWKKYDAFVFIGALGICTRTIAHYIEDKHTDPAVVCIDTLGKNVVSVLSGHVGGANDLTREIASLIGAHEVITTQSDNAGLWAIDNFEQRFGWNYSIKNRDLNECIFAFVKREPTALLLEIRDEGTDYLEATKPDHVTIIENIKEADPKKYKLLISISPFRHKIPKGMLCVHYVPRVVTVGFGLAHHPKDYKYFLIEMEAAMMLNGVEPGFKNFCTIDVKRDEEFVKMLQNHFNEEV